MNLKKFKQVALNLGTISLAALPLVGLAQASRPSVVGGAPETGQALIQLIERIATWIAIIFFAVAVIFIILAAFGYLTSGGDQEKVSSAKNKIVFAIVAIIVAAIAFAVPNLIFNLLGFTSLTQP